MTKRHRGQFKLDHPAPFELSRGKVEKFIRCKACFWLEKAKGVKFPGMPGFNLNTNTDTLLKRDFDKYRGKATHPLLENNGLGHLIPFEHEDLNKWTLSTQFGAAGYFHTDHEETNIRFGGGLDDVLFNTETKELHIVDYKSTANLAKDPKPVSLEGKWKEGYKRQMDMYVWIMRRKGFAVSDVGYFIYVDGLHVGYDGMIDEDTSLATMKFATSILPYTVKTLWVEKALVEIKELLCQEACPEHSQECEEGFFIDQVAAILKSEN